MSLIKNPKKLFRDSSSTSKTFFDENKCINRRTCRKDRVKFGRKVSVRMSDKLKVADKYFFEVIDSDVVKEGVVSTNNMIFRRIQRNKRINLSNIVKNDRVDRKSGRVKPA